MYQFSVFVHIVSAIVWVGGMLCFALVVVPVARRLPPHERAALVGAMGRRFRAVGWVCVALLIATGLVNSAYRGVTWADVWTGDLFGSLFGRLLAAKLGLVAVMLLLSAVHDFVVGPASARAYQQAGAQPSPALLSALAVSRRRAAWLARANTLVALVVVALAVMLVRGLPR